MARYAGTPFNIEDHRRYVPTPKRKKDDRKAERKSIEREPVKPNFKETVQLSCDQRYDTPCRCRRVSAVCVSCRREAVVTVGERAGTVTIVQGKAVNYKCNRCRGNGR